MRLVNYILTTIFIVIALVIGCSGGGEGGDTITPPDSSSPTENRILNGVRENTVPVGISSFAIGIPNKFPLEDNQQEEGIGFKVVARSVRRIATNEVFTFPERSDPNQVYETLKFFVESGHQVTHEIHILNGPGMRRASDWFVNEAANRSLYPDDFIDLLYSSNDFRLKILDKFAEVVVHAKRLEAIGIDVYICPELEDNHSDGDEGSYGILLDFLRAAGWSNSDGSLRRDRVVRNGGHVGRIPGIRYEKHPHSKSEFNRDLDSLRPGDFINTDGESFRWDDENPQTKITEADIREMIRQAEQKNVIFYIWEARLQGYKHMGNGHYQPYPHYLDRHYILTQPRNFIALLMQIPTSEVQIN